MADILPGVISATGPATLSNKTLDNTNVITVKDANLTIQDDLDTSKQAQFENSGISPGATRTVTLQDSDITMESTVGSQAKVNTHSALTTGIHGLVVTTPTVDQILRYNGVNFINVPGVTANVGPGVIFYLDATEIIPPGPGPQTFPLETLFKSPTPVSEVDESVVVNTSTALIDQYMYDTALGIVSINAGEWAFDTYCYISAPGGTSEVITSMGKVIAGTGTIAITEAGISRTATVTGATPFLAGDFNADITKTSYIITPTAVLMIIGFTSTSIVTVETLATYSNEAGVAYSIDRYLFQSSTGALTNLSVQLVESLSVQSTFAINTTDKLSTKYYAKTTNIGNITIHLVHGGNVHYTHFHTPLTTLHNDLPGLQGGAANQYYHATAAEYTKIQALGTISSQAANNVAITGGSITGITDLAIADGGTGASNAATARTNLGITVLFVNKGRAWIAHGDNVITLSTAMSNINYLSQATIHLPSMGGVTTRGPTETNPMTITTKPDPNDATFTRLLIRLNGGFGFTSCGNTGTESGTTERFDDVANTQTARTVATARDGLAGYSLNGFGFTSGGGIGVVTVGTTERFDDVANTQTARTAITVNETLTSYSLNGFGFTSCGFNGVAVVGTTERFDDVANTQTARTVATARNYPAGYSLNGFGFTSCGSDGVAAVGTTQRFDDVANTQTARTAATARFGLAGYSLNGFGFTSCGTITGIVVFGTTERFDDVANTQTARTAATARDGLAGYSLNGFGFTSCGYAGAILGIVGTTQRFDDVANTQTARTAATARDGLAGYSTNEYFINFTTLEA